jgi:hypothetical protein
MKKCSNCFQVKVLCDFYPKRPDGYQSRCKDCNAEVCRAYKKRKQQKDFSAWVKNEKP